MTRYLLCQAVLLLACAPASAQVPQLHSVMFEPDSVALDASAESQLQRFALDVGDRRVLIRGHADRSEGSEAHATDLSRRRATVVHEHLQAYGVSVGRITVEAAGFSNPAAGSVEDAGHNRRVEVIAYTASR